MDFIEELEKKSLTGESIKVFSGTANPRLARDIASYLKIELGRAVVGRFANEEIQVKIEENVRGQEVFVVQSMCGHINDSILELLIMMDALRRASARTITAVVPYFGYAKQEKKTGGREPISAKLVANLVSISGASRVITVDLHAAAIQGFFDIPVDNLVALPIFLDYYKKRGMMNEGIVVVSPDAGGVARARLFADRLNASLAIIFKRRPGPDVAELIDVVGVVRGKTAIIIDDLISTGGTLLEGCEALKKRGAKAVYTCATHAVLAGNAVEAIENSEIEEVVVTDTIPIPRKALRGKFVALSLASLLGEAIRRNYFHLSVSKLFD